MVLDCGWRCASKGCPPGVGVLQKGLLYHTNKSPSAVPSNCQPQTAGGREAIWLALKLRRQCRAMLLTHLDLLKAWRGGGAFCSACSQAQGKELVLNVCADLPSTDAAWAPVCLLCQHQRSYYMTKWDLYSGSISAGLTRQNGQNASSPTSFSQVSKGLMDTPLLQVTQPGLLQSFQGLFRLPW